MKEAALGLLFNRGRTSLKISIADGTVQINGRLGDAFETIEIKRTLVDNLRGVGADGGIPGNEIIKRSHCGVQSVTDSVANGRRRQERQNQIRARTHPPFAKRLSHVCVVLFDPKALFGNIKETYEPDGAVNSETGNFRCRAGKLKLQSIIDNPLHHLEVVEDIMNPPLDRIGKHKIPRRSRWF